MKFDYPLKLINSKLPKKQPLYYQKWLIVLFVGNIICLFALLMAEASEGAISLAFGAVGTLLFLVLFAFCLAKLYNNQMDGRDFIGAYIPSLTASSSFNAVYGWLKKFNRWFLICFSYLMLAIAVLIILSIGYSRIKS